MRKAGAPIITISFHYMSWAFGAALKIDPEVNGIKINNSEYLLTSYADDATLVLQDDRKSLNKSI